MLRDLPVETEPFEYTEEMDEALHLLCQAVHKKDQEAMEKYAAMLPAPPSFCVFLKEQLGAEELRKRPYYNTTRAEKLYGEDWLDNDDVSLL